MSVEDSEGIAEKAQFDNHVMIALIPTEEDAQRLAVEGGLPAEELHVTLRYLGLIDDLSGDAIIRSKRIAEDVAKRYSLFYSSKAYSIIAGHGVLGKDEPRANVLFLNGVDIDIIWNKINDGFWELESDGMVPSVHRPWIPHVTLGYGIELVEPEGPILFDRLRFALGSNNYDFWLEP